MYNKRNPITKLDCISKTCKAPPCKPLLYKRNTPFHLAGEKHGFKAYDSKTFKALFKAPFNLFYEVYYP